MAQAVAHFLFAALLVALFRDHYHKKIGKKKLSLHYVLIAGLAGVLPDIDIAAFWVLQFFGFTLEQVHRTITHTLLFAAIFFILGLATKKIKLGTLGKHKLKLEIIFFVLAFGILTHIFLDLLFIDHNMKIFYPFINSNTQGINLISYLPEALRPLAMPTLDGILLVVWIAYLELKHKISDFI
jgi:membrane-bound metal-dependent hydrolase YbcI (DUF457 family)